MCADTLFDGVPMKFASSAVGSFCDFLGQSIGRPCTDIIFGAARCVRRVFSTGFVPRPAGFYVIVWGRPSVGRSADAFSDGRSMRAWAGDLKYIFKVVKMLHTIFISAFVIFLYSRIYHW